MRYQGTPSGMMDFLEGVKWHLPFADTSQTDDEDRSREMSRSEVVSCLREHGFAPTDLTEYGPAPTYTPSPGSSFDDMVGIRNTYTSREVYDWLGY
jgi:hypothetical protein